jgi:hypothetical protein
MTTYRWDRIGKNGSERGETSKEFIAFTSYLNLGPGRSLRKAAEITASATGASVSSHCKRWEKLSVRWRWQDRVAAFDEFDALAIRKRHRRRLQNLERRRFDFEVKLQDAIETRVDQLSLVLQRLFDAPTNDMVVRKPDGTVIRVKGTSAMDIAIISREWIALAAIAVNGWRGEVPALESDSAPEVVPVLSFVRTGSRT